MHVCACVCMHAWMPPLEKIKSYVNLCYTCFTSLQPSATSASKPHVHVQLCSCGEYIGICTHTHASTGVYCIMHVCIVEDIYAACKYTCFVTTV